MHTSAPPRRPEQFDLHRAIALDGIDAVRWRCDTKQQRACVNAAAAMRLARPADPGAAGDVLQASMLVTGLPHKNLDRTNDPRHWDHDCVSARLRYSATGPAGLPYGSKARMLLLYLQTEAIRTGSAEVDLGPSVHAWLLGMAGQEPGGMSYRIIREQAARLFGCAVWLAWKPADPGAWSLQAPLLRWLVDGSGQRHDPAQWVESARHGGGALPARAVLHDTVFEAMRVSALPIRRSAVRCIGHNGTAMDQYMLLARRLPLLREPAAIAWNALGARFGSHYKRLSQMRPRYLDALRLALAVYPEARVDVTPEGLVLHPSPSTV